jgi:hypothetical protein
MIDDAPPPPMPPELVTKLWWAVCRVMDEDTRDRLVIAGVDLDDAGHYAVAELRAMDRSGRRRWLLRLWPCRSIIEGDLKNGSPRATGPAKRPIITRRPRAAGRITLCNARGRRRKSCGG